MLRPDLFGGLASHAGDSLYEHCYLPEFAKVVRTLRDRYDGSYERFWEDFRSRPPMSREDDDHLVMTYGCAACFSADDDGTVPLPFDLDTGELIPELWDRWLAWDPVRMVPRYADALRGLRAIYIDAGTRDQWFLDLGAPAMVEALDRDRRHRRLLRVVRRHPHGIDYRYPIGLRYLAERLSPDRALLRRHADAAVDADRLGVEVGVRHALDDHRRQLVGPAEALREQHALLQVGLELVDASPEP